MNLIAKFAAVAGIGFCSVSATQSNGLQKTEVPSDIPIQISTPEAPFIIPSQRDMVETEVANFRQEFARRVQSNDYSGKWNNCFSTKNSDYNPAVVKNLRTNLIHYTRPNSLIEGQPIVVIDEGHGHQTPLASAGYDTGGIHEPTGLREAKLVEPVGRSLKALLEEKADAIVVMTRGTAGDKDTLPQKTTKFKNQKVALQVRAELASHLAEKFPNSEVIFISLHTNTGNVPGSEIYYYAPYRNGPTDSPDAKRLATTINAHYRLHPTAPRSVLSNDFAVMRCTSVPAVLAELGSIDVAKDRVALQKPEAIASQIANGIESYFEQSKNVRVQYEIAKKQMEIRNSPGQSIVLASAMP